MVHAARHQVEKLDEVPESLCVGQDWQDDVRVVLFVVLREGVELDDELAMRDVIHGRKVKNTSALVSPEALGHFRDLWELAQWHDLPITALRAESCQAGWFDFICRFPYLPRNGVMGAGDRFDGAD